MRAISDSRLEDLESLTMESAKQLRAFFKYEGNDQRFFQKARLAAGVISGYSRIRASETNRMAVELAITRVTDEPKLLSRGK